MLVGEVAIGRIGSLTAIAHHALVALPGLGLALATLSAGTPRDRSLVTAVNSLHDPHCPYLFRL